MKSKPILLAVLFLVAGVFVFTAALAHEEVAPPALKDVSIKGETHHIEVKPESLEGYRVPYMLVTATIIDEVSRSGKTVTLHPMFGGNFHYGANVTLEPKKYLLQFHLDPPTFMRSHTRENQWLVPVEAEFVFDAAASFEKSIKIGSKETSDMKVSFEAEHAEEMFVLAEAEKEHVEHVTNNAQEESPSIAQQVEELLPFEHLEQGHWFAIILSILLWASLVYAIYSLINKFRKPSQQS